MKTLSLLGSTGSIGAQTVEIVRRHPDMFRVAGLSTNSRIDVLEKQIALLKPDAVAIMDESAADSFEKKSPVTVYKGMDGLKKIATLNSSDTMVNALVGSIGVEPTHDAILAGKTIALANKETLVCAGDIIMPLARKKGVSILPIDSEHSAIFQCLNGEDHKELKKLIITCSGGPFKNATLMQMAHFTIKDALKHPTWSMGAKITVDSSTWMNKGFEVIEAHHLFGVSYDAIEVVVHPQSIIHSLVEFSDNSIIAQLGNPEMTIPIQYALTYPKRLPTHAKQLDLATLKQLDFTSPDLARFPCLSYAYEAGRAGGALPCVLNAANEVAVRAFIDGKIGYLDIAHTIRTQLDDAPHLSNPTLPELLAIDTKTKEKTTRALLQ